LNIFFSVFLNFFLLFLSNFFLPAFYLRYIRFKFSFSERFNVMQFTVYIINKNVAVILIYLFVTFGPHSLNFGPCIGPMVVKWFHQNSTTYSSIQNRLDSVRRSGIKRVFNNYSSNFIMFHIVLSLNHHHQLFSQAIIIYVSCV
jgi:hypothetical protein